MLIGWVLWLELPVHLRGLEELVLRQCETHNTVLTNSSPCAPGVEREGGTEGSAAWVNEGSAWVQVAAVPAAASAGAWEICFRSAGVMMNHTGNAVLSIASVSNGSILQMARFPKWHIETASRAEGKEIAVSACCAWCALESTKRAASCTDFVSWQRQQQVSV